MAKKKKRSKSKDDEGSFLVNLILLVILGGLFKVYGWPIVEPIIMPIIDEYRSGTQAPVTDAPQPTPTPPPPTPGPELPPSAEGIPKGTLYQFLIYGQSLAMGNKSLPILSEAAPDASRLITFQGGPRGYASDNLGPLREFKDGTNGETPCTALGAAFLFKYSQGTSFGDNDKLAVATLGDSARSLKEMLYGTNTYKRLTSKSATLGSKGTTQTNSLRSVVKCIFFMQGEKDVKSTSFDQYKDDLKALRAALDADFPEARLLSYQTNQETAVEFKIPNAQLQAYYDETLDIVTPIYFLPYQQNDSTHLSAIGEMWLGAYFARAAHFAMKNERPPLTHPLTSTGKGTNTLRITMNVPVKPLVLIPHVPIKDKTGKISEPPIPNYGFKVKDNDVDVVISSVTIAEPDVVLITTETNVVDPYVSYGIGSVHYSSNSWGGLHDSDAETYTFDCIQCPVCPLRTPEDAKPDSPVLRTKTVCPNIQTRNLHNWCVQFNLHVTK